MPCSRAGRYVSRRYGAAHARPSTAHGPAGEQFHEHRPPGHATRRYLHVHRGQYRPETDSCSRGFTPPAWRNQRNPTGEDTPASVAASSVIAPAAIAAQNRTLSSRQATVGRPGDGICPRYARTSNCCFPYTTAHLQEIEVLRRSVESAQRACAAIPSSELFSNDVIHKAPYAGLTTASELTCGRMSLPT